MPRSFCSGRRRHQVTSEAPIAYRRDSRLENDPLPPNARFATSRRLDTTEDAGVRAAASPSYDGHDGRGGLDARDLSTAASLSYDAQNRKLDVRSDPKPRLSEHKPARCSNVGSNFALRRRGRAPRFLCKTRCHIETRPRVLSCSLRRHTLRSTCVRSLLPIPCHLD